MFPFSFTSICFSQRANRVCLFPCLRLTQESKECASAAPPEQVHSLTFRSIQNHHVSHIHVTVCFSCCLHVFSDFSSPRLRLFPELHQSVRCDRVARLPWQIPPQSRVHLHHHRPSSHGRHPHLPDLRPGEWPLAGLGGRVQVRLAGGVGRPPAGWV